MLNDTNCNLNDSDSSKKLAMIKKLFDYIAVNGLKVSNSTTVQVGGWIKTEDKSWFSEKEMDEYAENVLLKLGTVLSEDSEVLEIGFSSGLTLYKVAPHVKRYDGVDASEEMVKFVRANLPGDLKEKVSLQNMYAHEIGSLTKKYDCIIINSVMQYFPDYEYAEAVISQCKLLIKKSGYIFAGDVMDMDRKDELDDYIAGNKTIGYKKNYGRELFYPKIFFQSTSEKLGMKIVDISNKTFTIPNELSLFRYDVIIQKIGD